MKQRPLSRLLRHWSGISGLLVLMVAALSLAAGCSQSPSSGLEATVPDVMPAPTPLPTPDLRATVQAAVRATFEAAPIPTPAPTPDIQATVQAAARATVEAADTPTPFPTPDVQATVEAIVRATIEAPTPTPTSVPTPTNTPVPTATAVPTAAPTSVLPPVFPVDPRTVVPPGTALRDPQEIRVPNGHRGAAPWRDGGGQRIFSPWVYGTVYQVDQAGAIRPYIGISHTVNEAHTVWTVKLREDAVFQDGTPITARDLKAYWEHGAKPDNIVAWAGASLSLGNILGWEALRAGDTAEADGLIVIDDHTLEVTTATPFPILPLSMAAWHTGISKFDQVLTDDQWVTRPIGAGPYRWRTDPDTRQFLAEADVADFWGPSPNIKALHGLNITDNQVKVIAFENGEVDLMSIDSATYEAALDPGHPFNPLLRVTPYGGLRFIKNKIDMAPLEDLLVRKALAHGVDMRSIAKAVWGVTGDFATGLISPLIPCHNPDAQGHVYDPELARQELSESSYGSASNLPPLLIDLDRPHMFNMGVAVREYWKDNLGVDLDVLDRRPGMPPRNASQFYRISLGSWIPDPMQIVSSLTRKDSIEGLRSIPGGYPVLDALVEHARSLALDDPDRCAAWQAIEEEYMDKVYSMPIHWVGGVKWLVQPWAIGFESTGNVDINTLPWMYVLAH